MNNYCTDCKIIITKRAMRCRKCEIIRRYSDDIIRNKIGTTIRKKISTTVRKNNIKYGNVKIICKYCKKEKEVPYNRRDQQYCSMICVMKHKYLNPSERKKLSILLKGKTGGIRENSVKGKFGHYKGIFFQSSWELAYIVYNIEHNILFKRNWEYFYYQFENKELKFYPDFIQNKQYIEIKNYHSSKTDAKVAYFPKDKELIVLYKEDIQLYLNYCKNKYSNNFVDVLKDSKKQLFFDYII